MDLDKLNEEARKRYDERKKAIAEKFKDLPPYTEEELNSPPHPRVKNSSITGSL